MPRFSTPEERMKHPQGKLIPSSMWNDNELFGENLDDTVLYLMKVPTEELLSRLEQSATKLNDPWLKKQAWLAIALSHPDVALTTLQDMAQKLNIDDYGLFSLIVILGNISFFDELVKQYPAPVIAEYISQSVFYVYIKAAENGHQELLKKLEARTPEQTTEMFRVANFTPYVRAAKNGHLAVLKHFEQTRLDLVSAMIKAFFKNSVPKSSVVLEHMKEIEPALVMQLIGVGRSIPPLQTPNNFFSRDAEKPDEAAHHVLYVTTNSTLMG